MVLLMKRLPVLALAMNVIVRAFPPFMVLFAIVLFCMLSNSASAP